MQVDAWQAGFEAGQEAAAWARLPSGSVDGDGLDPMIKSPFKVRVLAAVSASQVLDILCPLCCCAELQQKSSSHEHRQPVNQRAAAQAGC